MENQLKIYVARLSDERTELIDETLSPDFIDVNEEDLVFNSDIKLRGKAYLAEDHLVIQLDIDTEAIIPCAICNEGVQKEITINGFYHTEEFDKIRGQVCDYTAPLREAILLEIPSHVECEGNCPKRAELKNYLQKGENQFPFSDLS